MERQLSQEVELPSDRSKTRETSNSVRIATDPLNLVEAFVGHNPQHLMETFVDHDQEQVGTNETSACYPAARAEVISKDQLIKLQESDQDFRGIQEKVVSESEASMIRWILQKVWSVDAEMETSRCFKW